MNAIKKARLRKVGRSTTMAKGLIALVVCALVFSVQGAPVQRVEGRLLVKAKPGVSDAAVQALLASQGAQEKSAIKQIGLRVVNVPPAKLDAVLEALKRHPSIEFAEPDYLLPPQITPNDTYYSSGWHLPQISAPAAWDVTTGSSNVIIAILDTGVNAAHPDLAAKIVPGWNFYDNNSDTSDILGHGTPVAGAAAAATDNGEGVASVAWKCLLMPIRVSDTNGFGILSAIAHGLTYAADQGARVANISFRASGSFTVSNAAAYFQAKGGVVTVSSGNEGVFDGTPDNPFVLTVGATDTSDSLASFSNTGSNIDLCAPGVDIFTTGVGGDYGSGTGTSFSAPIVAGVAALVFSANPTLSGIQVQDILKQSADDLGAPGWDTSYGWGRVNAYKAVQAALSASATDNTPPTTEILAPVSGSVVSGAVSIAVGATDDVGVTRVEWYLNGSCAGTNFSAPATFSWDTTGYTNGSYTLEARAYDAAGNVGSSATVSVSVQNVPNVSVPIVQIVSPAVGAAVSGVTSINVSTANDPGVTNVELYLNGSLSATSSAAAAAFSWNTASYPNGAYTLQAKAYDATGNVGASDIVSVSVQNTPPDTIAPVVQITAPSSGATLTASRSTKVYVVATDNVGVTRVDLLVDGNSYATSTSAMPIFPLYANKLTHGAHTVQAVAYDAAGNVARSAVVTVYR